MASVLVPPQSRPGLTEEVNSRLKLHHIQMILKVGHCFELFDVGRVEHQMLPLAEPNGTSQECKKSSMMM